MLFQNMVFSIMNVLSLSLVGFVLFKVFIDRNSSTDEYSRLLQAGVALFVPYLTFVAQGFCYRKRRRVSVLRSFLNFTKLGDSEIKSLYEK